MKLRVLSVLLIGLFLLSTTALAAETTNNGPYIGIAGGVSIFHDGDITVTGVGSATASYDTGYAFGASVGYKLNPIRFEFEFGYKKADMGDIGGFSVSDVSARVMSYMVNVLYDINNLKFFSFDHCSMIYLFHLKIRK